MTVAIAPTPKFTGIGFGGQPALNGFLYTYVAGTTTPQATWVDSTQTQQNTNPIQLDTNAQCNLWLDTSLVYKLRLTDSAGNQIWIVDHIAGGINITLPTLTQQIVGAILYPQTPAEAAASVTPVNFWVPSHLAVGVFLWDRYGLNATPGTTDMTAAINNSIAVAIKNGGGISQGMTAQYRTSAAINVPDAVTLRGAGRFETIITPVGSFNAINVHGSLSFANARSVQGLSINGSSLVGNGLDIQFAGLRCYFADLYITGCIGVGMRISGIPGQANSGSFDHVYERIECRANVGIGIQVYEQQSGYDGVFSEISFLRFIDVVSVGNNFCVQLAFTSVVGSFAAGELVTQATSGANGIVNYYDVANLRLYVRSVIGVFDTSHTVAGGTSGANAVPAATTGAVSINQVQWDQAGGDNCYFISIKATEGFVGIDFSRASNNHRIGQQYYDSTNPGTGTAIQVSKPSLGTVQYLTIDLVNSSLGNVGVNIIGGQNIFIGTVQMNSSGTPVSALAAAAGPIFLTTPRTVFTDANTPQIVYPAENISTYTPSFGGSGGSPALGNGTITGETYQHGNKVSLRIQLTFGSTTVMATSFVAIGLLASLAVKGSEIQLGQSFAIHGSSVFLSTASLNGTSITIPVSGGATNWNSSTPFVWANGDIMIITAEYEVA